MRTDTVVGLRVRRCSLHLLMAVFASFWGLASSAQGQSGGSADLLPVPPPDTAADASSAAAELSAAPGHNFYLVKGRAYGTDAYAGPLDVILNKGFAVAQWHDQDRHIFSYPYGWRAVWASVTNPGPAMERAGGWGNVLKRHLVPFGGDEFRDGQWLPNYFGHLLEGGLAYRRLLEWNRVHNVPFPTLTALLVTQFAAAINEAYETPVNDPWVQEHGTAGIFIDFVIMDPLGMILFHQDPIARFVTEKLGAVVWPRQASITFPGGRLTNNGEAVVVRPKLWYTDDYRVFLRGGAGLQVGISIPRDDGLEVAFGAGVDSHNRRLDADHIEVALFSFSTGVWIDRGGSLLVSATWNQNTDRRLAIDMFPGVASIAGSTIGAWFQLDQYYRPYIGITGRRTLGAGLGVGL
ncbi:MAG: hypothetical protein OEO79_10935 [Gemmatimonadota bacterium]|nr:hypothetical protein [Gemmatimonadota bacterium]MDH3424927.1 hypothetical protein [Gemmatimonadota bacterium]